MYFNGTGIWGGETISRREKVYHVIAVWSCDHDPREFPTLYSEADINELGGLLAPGGLLVNTWQMMTWVVIAAQGSDKSMALKRLRWWPQATHFISMAPGHTPYFDGPMPHLTLWLWLWIVGKEAGRSSRPADSWTLPQFSILWQLPEKNSNQG